MKLSIYVPDELWQRARQASDENPSSLVQTALERWLGNELKRPPYYESPPPDALRIKQLRDRLEREARALYREGYEEGLRLAEELNWSQLDRLAAVHWDIARWVRTGDDVSELLLAREDMNMLAEGYDPTPPTAWSDGRLDALKDVWKTVAFGEPGDATEPDTVVGAQRRASDEARAEGGGTANKESPKK
jgi:hypothetical protein